MSIKSKIERHCLCPFKRVFIRQHRRAAQDAMQEVYKDKLGECDGENCMAYKNGHCLRLEKSKEL